MALWGLLSVILWLFIRFNGFMYIYRLSKMPNFDRPFDRPFDRAKTIKRQKRTFRGFRAITV